MTTTKPAIQKSAVRKASQHYIQLMQQLGEEQTQELDRLLQQAEQAKISAIKANIAQL